MTVLHLAAKAGQLDIIRFLVENYRLDVNVKVFEKQKAVQLIFTLEPLYITKNLADSN